MNVLTTELSRLLPKYPRPLVEDMVRKGTLKTIPAHTEIIRRGDHVQVIPIVLSGLVKVLTTNELRGLLLYYIQPGESCIMTFAASRKRQPSEIMALTEQPSDILFLPVDEVSHWMGKFPIINDLFYQQYHIRYNDLITTIQSIVFENLEHRVWEFLQEYAQKTQSQTIGLTHQQMADHLGTAREVISRTLKKIEVSGRIRLRSGKLSSKDRKAAF